MSSAAANAVSSAVAPASSSSPPRFLLEVCVDSVASAVSAERGGASRVELCSALLDGGVTPSAGLIAAVRSAVSIPVMVLIRPRPGDFVYAAEEIALMRADIALCRRLGVAGVVSGALLPSGCIDEETTRALMEEACGTPAANALSTLAPQLDSAPNSVVPPPPLLFTFHRAFDLTPDLPAALRTLMQLGVTRVLTSGGANDAIAGGETIRSLVQMGAGRIIILAGGGLTPANIPALVASTGVSEVHASLRSFVWGATLPEARKVGVFMGGQKRNDGLEVEYGHRRTDESMVRSVCDAAMTFSPESTEASAQMSGVPSSSPSRT